MLPFPEETHPGNGCGPHQAFQSCSAPRVAAGGCRISALTAQLLQQDAQTPQPPAPEQSRKGRVGALLSKAPLPLAGGRRPSSHQHRATSTGLPGAHLPVLPIGLPFGFMVCMIYVSYFKRQQQKFDLVAQVCTPSTHDDHPKVSSSLSYETSLKG